MRKTDSSTLPPEITLGTLVSPFTTNSAFALIDAGEPVSSAPTNIVPETSISSEEYWQALAGVGYQLTEKTSLALAYRIISVDYKQSGFVYDTDTAGPNIGLIVKF